MKTQNNDNINNKHDEPDKNEIRSVEPAIKEPAPPLSRTQHIISGIAIIITIIILTIFATAVIKWQRQQNDAEQNPGQTGTQASSQEQTTVADPEQSETSVIRGDLESVLPVSLARGSNIKVGIDDPIIIINPLFSSGDGENDLVSLLFDSLVAINEEGRPMPELASSWFYDQSSRKLSFTIAPGHFFRDGRSVDAEDVIFTYNCLIADSYNGPYKGRFSEITEISQGSSEDTVVFTFSDKVSEPDYNLFTIGILKRDHYDYAADRVYSIYDDQISPEGSGAYVLDELTEESATVSLRPGYAGNISSIIFEQISSEDKFALLKEGQFDIVRSRWDERMKIRAESLESYSFYPSDSRIEAYIMVGNSFSDDNVLTTQAQRYAALLALADYELTDEQEEMLSSIDKPIQWYYFKGVDEQVSSLNLEQVNELARRLEDYNIEVEPVGLDWPEMASMLEHEDNYDLLLLPAPSNNRLPQGTILLARTHSLSATENANAWPAYISTEAIIINARLLQTTIAKNAFPLSTSTAGWTQRLENIRFYDPSVYGGNYDEEE